MYVLHKILLIVVGTAAFISPFFFKFDSFTMNFAAGFLAGILGGVSWKMAFNLNE